MDLYSVIGLLIICATQVLIVNLAFEVGRREGMANAKTKKED
jgi:hypothetical protein